MMLPRFRTKLPQARSAASQCGGRLLAIAHRGYSEKYPENTLIAFEAAIRAGADMIELDVRLSRDGRIVVIHDSRIDRTSDGRGCVKDMTLHELRKHSYHNGMAGFASAAIPTLDEAIDLAGERVVLNIEIKKSRFEPAGIEERLADLLERKHFTERVIVSSFDHRALHTVKSVNARLKTGMIYQSIRKRFYEEVRSLGVYSVHPALGAVDAKQLLWAKSRGLMVYPWVVKDKRILDACRAQGFIDGVMVNDLGLFAESLSAG